MSIKKLVDDFQVIIVKFLLSMKNEYLLDFAYRRCPR